MKILINIFLFSILFAGCYTKLNQNTSAGSYSKIMGREYFVPKYSNYKEFEKFSLIYGQWIEKPGQGYLFVRSKNDSAAYEKVRQEYYFYPDGNLEWLFIRDNGHYTIEQGKWGLDERDLTLIKLAGTTTPMRRIFKLEVINRDSIYLRSPNWGKPVPEILIENKELPDLPGLRH